MVMRDMLVTVVAGLGAGVGLALPLGLALEPALFEVSTTDAVSFVAAALLLAAWPEPPHTFLRAGLRRWTP